MVLFPDKHICTWQRIWESKPRPINPLVSLGFILHSLQNSWRKGQRTHQGENIQLPSKSISHRCSEIILLRSPTEIFSIREGQLTSLKSLAIHQVWLNEAFFLVCLKKRKLNGSEATAVSIPALCVRRKKVYIYRLFKKVSKDIVLSYWPLANTRNEQVRKYVELITVTARWTSRKVCPVYYCNSKMLAVLCG